jgi:HEAT repeat protein
VKAKSIPELIVNLGSETDDVRRSADAALLRLGKKDPKAVALLIQALRHRDHVVRFGVASILGRAEVREAIPALSALAADKTQRVDTRRMACSALRMIGHESIPSLRRLVQCDKALVRSALATALSRTKHKAAVEPLLLLLKDSERDVRSSAAEALSMMGKLVVPELLSGLKNADAHVRAGCADALLRIQPSSKDAVATLIELLGHTDRMVKREAAFAFRYSVTHAKDAVPALARALEDADRETRWFAAAALALIGKPAAPAVPQLIRTLRDRSGWVRADAAATLAAIGPAAEPAVDTLADVFAKEREEMVQESILEALAGRGCFAGVPRGRCRRDGLRRCERKRSKRRATTPNSTNWRQHNQAVYG